MALTTQGKLVLATPNPNIASYQDGVPIPVGFEYVEGTKEGGLVIKNSTDNNQFVWIPTESGLIEADPGIVIEDGTTWCDEYLEMKESVETYGGFYVGRYETSWDSANSKVASVPNVTPMNELTPIEQVDNNEDGIIDNNDEYRANWFTMEAKQRELYETNSSVTSGMIYISQWQTIINWMENIDNPNVPGEKYVNNSTGMGHFCYKYELCSACNGSGRNTYDLEMGEEDCWTCYGYGMKQIQITNAVESIQTGSNDNYKVNNIYDLAGNYREKTHLGVEMTESSYFNECGSDCNNSIQDKVSTIGYLNCVVNCYDSFVSSRLQLYIKKSP